MTISPFKNACTLILPFALVACGGGGGSSSGGDGGSETVTMVIGTEYTVEEGDSVSRDSDDARIRISKDSNVNSSTITLTQGSAHITRN